MTYHGDQLKDAIVMHVKNAIVMDTLSSAILIWLYTWQPEIPVVECVMTASITQWDTTVNNANHFTFSIQTERYEILTFVSHVTVTHLAPKMVEYVIATLTSLLALLLDSAAVNYLWKGNVVTSAKKGSMD